MGKFDRYGGGTPMLPVGGKPPATPDRLAGELSRINAQAAARAASAVAGLVQRPPRVAIALDATGRMELLLEAAKRSIVEIARRAASEAGVPIEIELIAYRDYDAYDLVVERSGPNADAATLQRWLGHIRALGGGANGGEAVEAALKCIAAGDFTVAILAGDEPSHQPSALAKAGRRETLSALHHAEALGRKGVAVHSFAIGDDPRTIADFAAISRASGGKSGRFDGSGEMIDLAVMSIIAAVKGAAGVRRYVAAAPQLSANARAFGQLLLAGK